MSLEVSPSQDISDNHPHTRGRSCCAEIHVHSIPRDPTHTDVRCPGNGGISTITRNSPLNPERAGEALARIDDPRLDRHLLLLFFPRRDQTANVGDHCVAVLQGEGVGSIIGNNRTTVGEKHFHFFYEILGGRVPKPKALGSKSRAADERLRLAAPHDPRLHGILVPVDPENRPDRLHQFDLLKGETHAPPQILRHDDVEAGTLREKPQGVLQRRISKFNRETHIGYLSQGGHVVFDLEQVPAGTCRNLDMVRLYLLNRVTPDLLPLANNPSGEEGHLELLYVNHPLDE